MITRTSSIYLLIIILGSVSMAVSMRYSVNIPLLDDYNLCLQFISEIIEQPSLEQKLLDIFSFNSGHPTVTQKLMFLLDWMTFGKVNFRHFIFMNNVVHFLILIALFRMFLLLKVQAHYFIPIPILIAVPVFTLNNWSSSFMHLCTLCFVLFSFYYLELGNRINFRKAIVLAILASLSSGAGILVFFSALPILWQRYDRRYWITWFAIALIIVSYYLWAYSISGLNTVTNNTSFVTYLINYLVFFGSIFKSIYHDHHVWSVVFGLLLLSAFAYMLLVHKRKFSELPILLSVLIFAILIGLLATILRSQFGLGATTAYRYRLYQALPVIFLIMVATKFWSESYQANFYMIMFFFTLMYGFRWENSIKELRSLEVQLKMGAMLFSGQNNVEELTFRKQELTAKILDKAKDLLIFRLDSNYSLPYKINIPVNKQTDLTTEFSDKIITDQFIYLRGKTSLKSGINNGTEIRIGYLNNGMLIHFPTISNVEPTDLLPERSESFVFYQPQRQEKAGELSYYVVLYSSLQGILAMEEIQN